MLARINTLTAPESNWFLVLSNFFLIFPAPEEGRASRDFSRLSELAFINLLCYPRQNGNSGPAVSPFSLAGICTCIVDLPNVTRRKEGEKGKKEESRYPVYSTLHKFQIITHFAYPAPIHCLRSRWKHSRGLCSSHFDFMSEEFFCWQDRGRRRGKRPMEMKKKGEEKRRCHLSCKAEQFE